MKAFIDPPTKIPFYLQIGIWFAKKITGKEMLTGKILAWYPKTAVGSAVMEMLVAHHDSGVSERLLKMVRMKASYSVACPFCIDMNTYQYADYGITADEFIALQGKKDANEIETFSEREKMAMQHWARLIQALGIPPAGFLDE